jgi:NAD(P)-dependent dehydrogenase (short-subunit alcohol dehydrogenase family)
MAEAVSLAAMNVAVTGGAHGIGRAVARQFARAGARVAIGDLDVAAAETVASECGNDAFAMKLDVADPASFREFLDTAERRHGALDVLVNNAGIDWIGPFHEEPDAASSREVNVNLLGTVYGSRLGVQRMLPRQRGHIVNVASGAGRVPLPFSAVYSATKHGIVGLTESLRLEYHGSGLRFSLIQPAQVETQMIEGQARPKRLPLITPDDVAEAVLAAVRRNRFDVWVPASQGVSAKAGLIAPRRVREAVLRAIGVGEIGGAADQEARRPYHERMFGG